MRTRIIAEVASNHGGDLELAKRFIREAAAAGVDYVKFQSWQASRMSPSDPQYDWFVRSELSDAAHRALIDECSRCSVRFLTTCFHADRVDFLASLGLPEIKVASPDLASVRMLRALRQTFEHVLVSTGMGPDEEVRLASHELAGGRFTLFHCVSLYPLPADAAHLSRMNWLRQFTSSVGWSDHAEGLEVAKAAISAGANYLEKHICLGRNGPGRVMPWDATPDEFVELVEHSRRVEVMMGESQPPLAAGQIAARDRFIGRFGDNA